MRPSTLSLLVLTAFAVGTGLYFPTIGYPFALTALIGWGTISEERAREDRITRYKNRRF